MFKMKIHTSALSLLLVASLVQADMVLKKPIYPKEAYEKCIEGSVVLSYEVGESGYPVNVEILESDPDGVFDEAAKKHFLKQKPMKSKDGKNEHRYTFNLEGCNE